MDEKIEIKDVRIRVECVVCGQIKQPEDFTPDGTPDGEMYMNDKGEFICKECVEREIL